MNRVALMTHVSCPSCRLRFTPVAAARLAACPTCNGPLHATASAERVLGFRLVIQADSVEAWPTAVEVALLIAGPHARSCRRARATRGPRTVLLARRSSLSAIGSA